MNLYELIDYQQFKGAIDEKYQMDELSFNCVRDK